MKEKIKEYMIYSFFLYGKFILGLHFNLELIKTNVFNYFVDYIKNNM